MAEHPPRRGIVVPYYEIVVREVMGYPVVTKHVPWTALDVHRHWGRFGGGGEFDDE